MKKPMGDAQKTRAANARNLDRDTLSSAKKNTGIMLTGIAANNFDTTAKGRAREKATSAKGDALYWEGAAIDDKARAIRNVTKSNKSTTLRDSIQGRK